jgi:hypothetical protein
MANRDVVALGTSAGGVEALLFLAKPRAGAARLSMGLFRRSHWPK